MLAGAARRATPVLAARCWIKTFAAGPVSNYNVAQKMINVIFILSFLALCPTQSTPFISAHTLQPMQVLYNMYNIDRFLNFSHSAHRMSMDPAPETFFVGFPQLLVLSTRSIVAGIQKTQTPGIALLNWSQSRVKGDHSTDIAGNVKSHIFYIPNFIQ